jgi:hypothetical protein
MNYFTPDYSYCISVWVKGNTTKLFKRDVMENYKRILIINYAIDIERETIQYWADKLMNLRVFS